MSRRRGKGRRRQLWTLVLVAADTLLALALYATNGAGPVVLAAIISVLLVAFSTSRRRTRRSR